MCLLCVRAYLPVALHFLLLDAKPDRLIIETTGLGHPARLLDTLRTNYRDRLEVRAVLGFVDPADFAKPEMRQNPVFIDQIQLSDVVVMNKLDTASPDLVADFQEWADKLFPPKLLIAGTSSGISIPRGSISAENDERLPLYPEAHHRTHTPVVVRPHPRWWFALTPPVVVRPHPRWWFALTPPPRCWFALTPGVGLPSPPRWCFALTPPAPSPPGERGEQRGLLLPLSPGERGPGGEGESYQ